jgi:hypothetical protein
MTKNINDVFVTHIKYLNQNEFIYEVKSSYDLLSEDRKKIYRLGFINGAKEMMERKRHVKLAPPNKKVVGFAFKIPKPSDVQSVINKVCIHFEVHKETLMGKSRTSSIVRARNVIHNLLFEKYNMNLSEIGRYFGQDHTTVLHSIEMKRDQRRFWSTEKTLWQEYEKIKETISETIRE